MKLRITATVDEATVLRINEKIRNNRSLRNKSHLIETALQEFLEKEEK